MSAEEYELFFWGGVVSGLLDPKSMQGKKDRHRTSSALIMIPFFRYLHAEELRRH